MKEKTNQHVHQPPERLITFDFHARALIRNVRTLIIRYNRFTELKYNVKQTGVYFYGHNKVSACICFFNPRETSATHVSIE